VKTPNKQKERHQPACGVWSRQATQRRAVLVAGQDAKEVQPARLRRMEAKPTSGGRCWLPDRTQKKCNQPGYAAWRRSRQAEAGAGCRTGRKRSATSPATPHGGEADKRRPVLVAGQDPQKERHQPACGVWSRQAKHCRGVLVRDGAFSGGVWGNAPKTGLFVYPMILLRWRWGRMAQAGFSSWEGSR